MKEYATLKGIHVDIVNGYDDHCHCLVSMKSKQSMADIMHALKGESSHWINKNNLCPGRFGWQDQYFAIAVSHPGLQRVRNYILNQEEHHKRKDFQEEYQRIVKEHGFSITDFD